MSDVDDTYDGCYDDDDEEEYDDIDYQYEDDEVTDVASSLSTVVNLEVDGVRKPSYKDVLLIPEKRVFIPPSPPQVEIKPWRPELAIVSMRDIIGDVSKNEPTSFQGLDDDDDDGIWGLVDNVMRSKFLVARNQQNRSNTALLTRKQQEVKMNRISLKS